MATGETSVPAESESLLAADAFPSLTLAARISKFASAFAGQLVFDEEDRQENYLYNYSYGAGFHFKLGETPFKLDWAGTAVGEFFEDNQQITLNVAF